MRSLVLLLAGAVAFSLVAADPSRPSPPLSVERLNAPPVTLAQFRGKVVALTFILTTCPHCQDLTDILDQLAPEYAPRGVQFLECAFNMDAQSTMKEFVDRFKPPFPVGWASDAAVRAYLHISTVDQRPFYAPHMVFLDRRGMIRADIPGESRFFTNPEPNIRAELEQLLKPAAPATFLPARP